MEATGQVPLISVFDMPEALAFYRDKLGFEVISASPIVDAPEGRFSHWMWLRLGSAELMLNTAYDEGERPERPDPARIAAHADTIIYFGCADVDEAYRLFQARGVELDPPKRAPYGMNQLYLKDPDGYGLCFQHPA